MAQFRMTNLGFVQKYLVQFKLTTHGLLFHQTSYARNFLNEFHMADSTPICVPMHENTCIQHDIGIEPINATLYRWMVGKLHYLTKVQPDLQYFINIVSRHMQAS
jgi:hypothetical protein